MKSNCKAPLKARGAAVTGASAHYILIMQAGIILLFVTVLLLLTCFVPDPSRLQWLIPVVYLVWMGMVLIFLFCSFYSVVLEPDKITVYLYGIAVRTVPVSQLKLFCSAGIGNDSVLCLACYSVEEMAQKQEQRLLKSFLHKHNVAFRKRSPNWKKQFAQEYLTHRSTFGVLKNQDFVMMAMNPALQQLIGQLYPQLPYRNLDSKASPYLSRFSGVNDRRTVCLSYISEPYTLDMQPDGIHLFTKRDRFCIPAQRIKTAVRVDIFKEYDRHRPRYMPLIFVSCLSEEELAAQAPGEIFGRKNEDRPSDMALLALISALNKTRQWNSKQQDSCVIRGSEANWQKLRTLYPHTHFNEIGACWLNDKDPITQEEAT